MFLKPPMNVSESRCVTTQAIMQSEVRRGGRIPSQGSNFQLLQCVICVYVRAA